MTDEDVIAKAAEIFGTKYHQFENGRKVDGTSGKPIYVTCVTGARARAIMESILQYMGSRRSSRIKEILAIDDAKPNQNEARRSWSKNNAKSKSRDSSGRFANT
jgi:hypothetical protein